MLLFAAPAHAQICRQPGDTGAAPSGFSYINCDMYYDSLSVHCLPLNRMDRYGGVAYQKDEMGNIVKDAKGNPIPAIEQATRPSCPSTPMPMLRTPLKSPVRNFSPYVYSYPRINDLPVDEDCQYDPSNGEPRSECANLPYKGQYLVGTKGGPVDVFGTLGGTAPGEKRLAGCAQIYKPMDVPKLGSTDEAMQNRLQIDSCANQYILNYSIFPWQKSRSRLLNTTGSGGYITLDTECQPLSTFPETENEYSASDYIKVAWIKTLQDDTYRKDKVLMNIPGVVQSTLSLLGGSSFSAPTALVGGKEPHLPSGVKIDPALAIPPPDPFPVVELSNISAVPYEEIVDPTHPYSPRWDYGFTDRDYSWLVKAGSYMTSDAGTNSVYCAGVHKSNESDSQKKADQEVRVDVLSFREKAFTEGMLNRIGFNTICKKNIGDGDTGSQTGYGIYLQTTSWCWHYTTGSLIAFAASCIPFGECQPSLLTVKRIGCWKCFGLGSDTVDDENKHPPCATHYGGKDLGIRAFCDGITVPCVPGGLNAVSYTAACSLDPLTFPPFTRQGKWNIDTLCNNLRKPFTPLNKLKMRYHNPADKNNVALTEGVPEGYTFKEYFGNHMPYPRLWDTGVSLQKSGNQDRNYQDPLDTTGQYTAIVGVGREGVPKSASSTAQKAHGDERCKLGGWGGSFDVGGQDVGAAATSSVSSLQEVNDDGTPRNLNLPLSFTGISGLGIDLPDPLTSWTELKLYQARVDRYANLSCIGRYEKVFKGGSSENLALSKIGGEWARLLIQKCPKVRPKPPLADGCTFISLDDYNKQKDSDKKDDFTIPQLRTEGWPLSWHGYMADGTGSVSYEAANMTPSGKPRTLAMALAAGANQFPQFGGAVTWGATLATGFDHAQMGDIVMMPRGGADDGLTNPGLPKVGIITEISWATGCQNGGSGLTAAQKSLCYVRVFEGDNGKSPDVCGTTDSWGEFQSRYIYPPGFLPPDAVQEYKQIKSSGSCEDTRLWRCELKGFYSVGLYRPANIVDLRSGCGKTDGKDCK